MGVGPCPWTPDFPTPVCWKFARVLGPTRERVYRGGLIAPSFEIFWGDTPKPREGASLPPPQFKVLRFRGEIPPISPTSWAEWSPLGASFYPLAPVYPAISSTMARYCKGVKFRTREALFGQTTAHAPQP